ncbi:MAG: SufD family Fe-S cluster assembly protein [Desulforudis sp.]|jgi:Fe-S cluster assembly scaffold protein SufB|nr:SufD family Fe-S cluster assembly protein [Clostridia bacterium]RJX16676.1 MAG: SufD family Fe-S cluster assembly protein [Desulforudis sp.]
MSDKKVLPQSFKKESPRRAYLDSLERLDILDRNRLVQTGIEFSGTDRSGTFMQMDDSIVHCGVEQPGVEVLSTEEAVSRYDWLADYYWKSVSPEADEYTAYAREYSRHGYFIRALPGVKASYPVQASLYLAENGFAQAVHNIVIVEEGAELNIITGCASGHAVRTGMHLGISEFYIKKNAKLTFTMIHNWGEDMYVHPRSGMVVEEGGVFLSNFVCMHPVHELKMNPLTRLTGPGALVRSNSILVAQPGVKMDVGSRVWLEAPNTKAEIIARALTTGGDILNRGHLRGDAAGIKAHLECHGLILSPEGLIHAIPELEARVAGAEMSHEAAVGKIAQEEIEYLMARGLSEEEATSTIVRGFLNVKMDGLPAELQAEIDRAVKQNQDSIM